MLIGIMGAMPEETAATAGLLADVRTETHGGREYTRGSLEGHGVVCVHARVGKVAAAVTATELIVRFGVERLVFTGLAGALSPELRVGDVVVADGLVQHDMDASPLFPRLEVPLTGVSRFVATPAIAADLARAAEKAMLDLDDGLRDALGAEETPPRRAGAVVRGDVATGDRFVGSGSVRDTVRALVPGAVCVEMEGAAVAQVCHDYALPFGVVRVISDHADGTAATDFFTALRGPAAAFSAGVVRRILRGWAGEGG
ncbi:MAG: 5'-methylthioadenosine/adenosylhomocysteine nucleosidase [Phycisphaerales bacterium JB054]